MLKVCLLQTDNRLTLNYLLLTQKVNKMFCANLGYEYMFIEIDDKYNFSNKQYAKLYIVNDILQNYNYDILIFLDSDAWIQNDILLNDLINNLINDDNKNGCFSRDPYLKKNTYINSGSFIIKNNDYIKQMYNQLISLFEKDLIKNNNDDTKVRKKNIWCDQFYISNFVFNNKEKFYIFVPDILNTPNGKILRHNWWKNKKMYDDLNELILTRIKNNFNFNKHIDKIPFPNLNPKGNEYK